MTSDHCNVANPDRRWIENTWRWAPFTPLNRLMMRRWSRRPTGTGTGCGVCSVSVDCRQCLWCWFLRLNCCCCLFHVDVAFTVSVVMVSVWLGIGICQELGRLSIRVGLSIWYYLGLGLSTLSTSSSPRSATLLWPASSLPRRVHDFSPATWRCRLSTVSLQHYTSTKKRIIAKVIAKTKTWSYHQPTTNQDPP